jgi:hypothetical protein
MKNLGIFALLLVVFVSACGLSSEQKKESKEAIETLQKIAAGVETGRLNYMECSKMIIEAKAQVNQAVAVLPDGQLKTDLTSSMGAYEDATEMWSQLIESRGLDFISSDSTFALTLKSKYPDNPQNKDSYLDEKTRSYLFEKAKIHLEKAAALVR